MLLMLNTLSRIGYNQLPRWARPDHPIMRSVMGYGRSSTWRRRFMMLLLMIFISAIAVALGYVVAQNQAIQGEEPTVRDILYWPLVGAQTLALVLAIALTTNVIALERQKQTWDTLKLSLSGVSLTLRARWIAVFFKLGWLLALITIGRLIYVGLLLDEMVEFQGRALDLRISGITPEVSLDVTVILMAAMMTAFILMPFVAVAVAAAIGIVVSVFTRTRSVVILGLLLLIGLRLATTIGSLVVGNTVFSETGVSNDLATLDRNTAWYRLLFSSAEGDMMLRLFHLDTLGQIWADVSYTIYIGGVMLLVVLVQAMIANGLVLYAAWRATKPSSN